MKYSEETIKKLVVKALYTFSCKAHISVREIIEVIAQKTGIYFPEALIKEILDMLCVSGMLLKNPDGTYSWGFDDKYKAKFNRDDDGMER